MVSGMMTGNEFRQQLLRLGLSLTEAAPLIGVNERTVRRWSEGEEVSGPAEQAVRAWIRLFNRHLPWRPDSTSIMSDDQDQIARHRAYAIELDRVLARVDARGGARLPWVVDWDRGKATLGPVEVSFYKLLNGGFSLEATGVRTATLMSNGTGKFLRTPPGVLRRRSRRRTSHLGR